MNIDRDNNINNDKNSNQNIDKNSNILNFNSLLELIEISKLGKILIENKNKSANTEKENLDIITVEN